MKTSSTTTNTTSKPAAKSAKKTASPKKAPVSHGVGRRKSAVARVWLRRGTGAIRVNGKDFKEYFDTEMNRLAASAPFKVCSISANYDVDSNVMGGGLCAQADAIKLGITRALIRIDESVRPMLKKYGFTTRDPRQKERKKYGRKAARRGFQFVKR